MIDLQSYLEDLLETLNILTDPDAMEALENSAEDVREGRVCDHASVKRELG